MSQHLTLLMETWMTPPACDAPTVTSGGRLAWEVREVTEVSITPRHGNELSRAHQWRPVGDGVVCADDDGPLVMTSTLPFWQYGNTIS